MVILLSIYKDKQQIYGGYICQRLPVVFVLRVSNAYSLAQDHVTRFQCFFSKEKTNSISSTRIFTSAHAQERDGRRFELFLCGQAKTI